MDLTVQPDRRGQPVPSPSLLDLIRHGVLDAELGALVSLLVEARVPLVVASDGDPGLRRTVLAGLLATLPASARRIELAGPVEDFAWLPEAHALGWQPDGPTPRAEPVAPADPADTVLVAGDLSEHEPGALWSGATRIAVRAASLGYGLAATIRADSLEAVLSRLRQAHLTDDELSRLGVVLVVGEVDGGPRVVAAHYVRPVVRDEHGHVQRLGPAILATYDPSTSTFEHFAWGVIPELAMRVGRRAGDFELELDRRRDESRALLTSTHRH